MGPPTVQATDFSCQGLVEGGYYADPKQDCQVYHVCLSDPQHSLYPASFLCPNGTLFNQEYFICDWWFNVDCSLAESFYSINEEIAAEQAANSPDATALSTSYLPSYPDTPPTQGSGIQPRRG